MIIRTLVSLLLLSFGTALGTAELPPLAEQTRAWAASLGHGAVAAAVKRDGRWTYAMAGQPFAAGHAEVPAERVLFEIGSISKVFTGILLAEAAREGKLGLDDTLAQRLPVKFGNPATGAVTLKQLATHTSSLPRLPENMTNVTLDDPYAGYDKEAMFAYLVSGKLEGQPPCAAAYSNLAFVVLGVVLETVYGKPWAALIQAPVPRMNSSPSVVDAQFSFHRDAAGKIDRLTLHQGGRDIPASRDAGPAPRIEFPDAAALVEYEGEYDFGRYQPGARITVRVEVGTLLVAITGQPPAPVFNVGKDRFEYDIVVAALTFERGAAGKVVAVVLHQNGLDARAPRL